MGFLRILFKKDGRSPDPNDVKKPCSHPCDTETEKEPQASLADFVSITLESENIGTSTGSTHRDFYVYEWFIKNTGEIFYVGKGRNNRYKEYHEKAYVAEEIRKIYDTDVRFVAKGLSEEEALDLETKRMSDILNDTNDRLTNRFIPFCTKRDNGYGRSPSTPPFKFENTPILYASEIDEHYFGIKGRSFDSVEYKNLSRVAFIDKGISREELEIVYGGNYENYYNETISLLEANGNRIIKSKYAKSVSAWIYGGDDNVTNNDHDEKQAEERVGRRIASYHLLDVWRLLKAEYENVSIQPTLSSAIHPINNRVPLAQIRNKNNWEKGFDEGFKYWEQGDTERKNGNIEEAIRLFDKARYNGYFAPVLYNSYAMAYRKLSDLDNEIDILTEGIERHRATEKDSVRIIVHLEEQRKKALVKLQKRN